MNSNQTLIYSAGTSAVKQLHSLNITNAAQEVSLIQDVGASIYANWTRQQATTLENHLMLNDR